MNEKVFRIATRVILSAAFAGFILACVIGYIAPLGTAITFRSGGVQKDISELFPNYRVTAVEDNGTLIQTQTDDLVYFTTRVAHRFDHAKVRVTYQNPYPDQDIFIGYRDQYEWHYNTKLLDSPLLNNLGWSYIGNHPRLYQRQATYSSPDKFLNNLPNNDVIGTYQYDPDVIGSSDFKIADYKPQQTNTTISIPLRGKHTMYVYVDNEPFRMKIQKQDLNWYEDPDVLTVQVYKDGDIVFDGTVDDDGITDASRRVGPVQTIEVNNPGPELPEPGVYKVILDATKDIAITNITTNLHKIVFDSPIFPIASPEVYPGIIKNTTPTQLFTDAKNIRSLTYHNQSLQELVVNQTKIPIDEVGRTVEATPSAQELSVISLPKSNVVLDGFLGYFSVRPEQYFRPLTHNFTVISNQDDINKVNYILADYLPAQKEGVWMVNEQFFDLNSAFIDNGRLSWIIKAPQLKDNGRSIKIKDIEVSYFKDPLIQKRT